MVDRRAVEEALHRIGDDTLVEADAAIGVATTEAVNHSRLASNANNSMVTNAAAKTYQAGLDRMVKQIRDYAGAKANVHGNTLATSADNVPKQLVRAHESRINAPEGKVFGHQTTPHQVPGPIHRRPDDGPRWCRE